MTTKRAKRTLRKAPASRLGKLRERIDRVDERLVGLLEERASLVEKVAEDKRRTGRVVFDPGREKEVRARLARLAKGRFPAPALEVIFREIVSASRALETPTRVGFLGRTGSLAHWAALRRFGSSSSFAEFGSGEALLSALEKGDREFALVSLEGLPEDPGFDAFDVLLSSRARVYGEFHQEGGVVLLGATKDIGRKAPRTRRLFGHPGLLARCSRWLEAQGARVSVQAMASSLDAAERARKNGGWCVGTPALAGEGMQVLPDQIDDAPLARRRYLMLSLASPAPSKHDRTAFLAVLPHEPGALHGVLGCIARRRLNLAWIETRASQGRSWQHVFLFEIEGNQREKRVSEALEAVRRRVEFLQNLGSFPADPA